MTDSHTPQANDNAQEPEPDPEIQELLDFEPVPRRFKKEDGWTAPLQRAFIAELARHGSPTRACEAVGKVRSGVDKLYKSPQAEGFRAAWDKAVELAERRRAAELRAEHSAVAGLRPPFVDHRRKAAPDPGPLPGQVLNEHGEWEDEESLRRRGAEAKDSISAKLLNCRRLYLCEIASSPGKRAAFEILTEYPIDWDKAERLEPQADEPWHKPNMRQPDMLLTMENGWHGGLAHGPDKQAELRAAVDEYRAEEGLEPVEWESDPEPVRDREAQPVPQTGAHRDGEDRAQQPECRGHSGPDHPEPKAEVESTDQPSAPAPAPPDQSGPRIRGL